MKRKTVRFMDLGVAGGVLLTIGIIALASFGASKAEYSAYEKQYEEEVAALEALKPSAPKNVYIDNDFVTYDSNEFISSTKSQFKNVKTIRAAETDFSYNVPSKQHNIKVEHYNHNSIYGISLGGFDNVGGGSVTFKINVLEATDADITIDMACANYNSSVSGNTNMENLADYIKLTVDGLKVDLDGIALTCNDKSDWYNFQTLVLDDLHFKAGENTVVLETISPHGDGHHVMPNLSHMHVFAKSQFTTDLNVNGDVMSLTTIGGVDYLTLVGTCNNYRETRLMMDLCRASSNVNVIPSDAYTCSIQDGFFLMKIQLNKLPTARLYTHFFVDGAPLNTGRAAGDILTAGFSSLYGNNWNNPAVITSLSEKYNLLCQNAQMVVEIL